MRVCVCVCVCEGVCVCVCVFIFISSLVVDCVNMPSYVL